MKFFIRLFLFSLFLIPTQAYNQTASLLPNAVQQFFDNNGNPLSVGTVDTYVVGSSTRKTTWKNSGETVANTNPIVLDAGGKAIIYGEGIYRQVVKDRNGNLIWDAVTTPAAGGGGSGGTATTLPVGWVSAWSGITAPPLYQFAYGQEILRANFPALFTALTITQNVNCTNTSTTITGLSDTTQIPIGGVVELSCVVPGTTVASKTASTVTLSNPSNVSLSASAVFFLYGNGNGSTTFNLPDLRGRVVAGRNNMGGTASSLLTEAYYGENPNSTGAIGGDQSRSLLSSNLPAYTPAGTVATTSTFTGNAATPTGTIGPITPSGTVTKPTITVNQNTFDIQSVTHTTSDVQVLKVGVSGLGITAALDGNPVFNGNPVTPLFTGISATPTGSVGSTSTFTGTAQGGTSTAFSIVQPTITLNYIIKVSPGPDAIITSGVDSVQGMTGVLLCGTNITCNSQTISLTNPPVLLIGTDIAGADLVTALQLGRNYTSVNDQMTIDFTSGSDPATGIARLGATAWAAGEGSIDICAQTLGGNGLTNCLYRFQGSGLFRIAASTAVYQLGAPIPTSLQIVDGSAAVPVTNDVGTLVVSRYENVNSIVGEGVWNNAIQGMIISRGTAQGVGVRGTAYRAAAADGGVGGDMVGVYGEAVNLFAGFAAFGGNFGARGDTATSSAIGVAVGIDNRSGNHPYTPTNAGTIMMGFEAAYGSASNYLGGPAYTVRASIGNQWDVGMAFVKSPSDVGTNASSFIKTASIQDDTNSLTLFLANSGVHTDGINLTGTGSTYSGFAWQSPGASISGSGAITGTTLTVGSPVTVPNGGTGIASGTSGGVPYYSSTTTIASSALLTNHAIVLGGGAAAAPKVVASLGTTTTLLHGAAASDPTFSAVVSADMNITTTSCTNQFVTAISAGGVGTCTTDTLASAQHANQGTTTTVLHGNAGGNPSWSAISLTTDVSGILPGANGGTNNGFMAFSGPATSLKTFTVPNASATILTDNAAVTPAQGGTGLQTLTARAVIIGEGTSNVAFATTGTAGRLLIDQGAGADPSFNAVSGDGTITNAGALTVTKLNGNSFTQATAFTPTLAFGGASVGIVYTAQAGLYTQLGKLVCINVYISISNKGSSAGSATITGLPTASNGNPQTLAPLNTAGLTFTGQLQAYTQGATTVNLQQNNGGTVTNISNTNFTAPTDIGLSGCYFTP